MLVGHHAVAFAAKRLAPSVSLGALQFACALPDLLTFLFQIAGVEHARTTPGFTAFSSLDGYDTALSHSLATTVLWSVLLAALWLWRSRNPGAAVVLGAVVFSHWVLDVVSHPPQIALVPGIDRYLGFGLWNSIPATFIVEGALWLFGIAIYLGTTRATSQVGTCGLWAFVFVLTLLWIATPFVPQPPGEFSHTQLGIALALYAGLIALAQWTDRNRTVLHEMVSSQVTATGGKP